MPPINESPQIEQRQGQSDREHTLLTLSALVSQRLDPHTIEPDQWQPIVEQALLNGLGPQLAWKLRQYDINDSSVEQLKRAFWIFAARAVSFEMAQMKIQAALTDAQISAVWLKGGALAYTVYSRPSLRPMSDLDVLVPFAQREHALRAVKALGYHFYGNDGSLWSNRYNSLFQKISHHYVLQDDGIILELHYHLLGQEKTLFSNLAMEWMWSQTETFTVGDTQYLTFKPEANLLYLSAHAILQHGENTLCLKNYFDLYRLVQSSSIDWDLVLQQAVALKCTYPVERALTLSSHFFETPIPKPILQKLADLRPIDENFALAIHLQGPDARFERMRLLLPRLSFKEKVSFILRIVFPPMDYMRRRYEIDKPGPVRPYYYLYRWADQAQSILKWLWTTIRLR